MAFRAAALLVGGALLLRHEWTAYGFGVLLLITSVKMLVARHDNFQENGNLVVVIAKKRLPATPGADGIRFFVRRSDGLHMTPLFVALLMIGSFALLFGLDSVPAALSVTTDPLLVFTSSLFAVIGLRAMYFAVATYLERLRYLKLSLGFLLAYVGVKTMLEPIQPIQNLVSLAVISGILLVGVSASVMASDSDTARLVSPLADELEELGSITIRNARRVVISVIGSTALLLGFIMLIAPGPGILGILAGLAILGVEFEWARRWLMRSKEKARDVEESVRRRLHLAPRGDRASRGYHGPEGGSGDAGTPQGLEPGS